MKKKSSLLQAISTSSSNSSAALSARWMALYLSFSFLILPVAGLTQSIGESCRRRWKRLLSRPYLGVLYEDHSNPTLLDVTYRTFYLAGRSHNSKTES